MKFKAGDLIFNTASVTEARPGQPAPQTGNLLRSLTIQFRAPKQAMHEAALEAAQQTRNGGLFSLTDSDEPEAEWAVRESAFQYVGSEPWGINHHSWYIEQIERLECTGLTIGSVELKPYEYVEETSEEGALRLAARAPAGETELRSIYELSAAGTPVDVVRVGINPEPRKMVVEAYVWGDGREGPAVALSCRDVAEPRVALAAPSTGMGHSSQVAEDLLDELLTSLKAKGVLSQDEAEGVRSAGHERAWQRVHTARHVQDLDGWQI